MGGLGVFPEGETNPFPSASETIPSVKREFYTTSKEKFHKRKSRGSLWLRLPCEEVIEVNDKFGKLQLPQQGAGKTSYACTVCLQQGYIF